MEHNSLPLFQYDKLQHTDSIRVLSLLAGQRDISLTFQLLAVRTSSSPAFEALSYTWGSAVFPRLILEDRTGAAFPITENLYDALQALRFEDRPRTLWIDALCINQQDIPEKNHQVAQMDKIYRDAANVLVWLGKSDCRKGVAELARIGQESALHGVPRVFPFITKVNHLSTVNHLTELARNLNWEEVSEFFNAEWFERVWIMQEFLLPQDVVLLSGSSTISYDLFSRATAVLRLMILRPIFIDALRSNATLPAFLASKFFTAWSLIQKRERFQALRSRAQRGFTYLPDARPLLQQANAGTAADEPDKSYIHPTSLVQFCAEAKFLKCTNDLDRVYGMLALADGALAIVPNYALSPAKMYQEVSKKLLLSGDLAGLHHAVGISEESAEIKLSWVTDWRYSAKGLRLGGLGTPRFSAGGRARPRVEFEKEIIMTVKAVVVDTIENEGYLQVSTNSPSSTNLPTSPITEETEPPPRLEVLTAFVRMINQFDLPDAYPTGDASTKAVALTLVANACIPSISQALGDPDPDSLYIYFLLGLCSKEFPDEKIFVRLEMFLGAVGGAINIGHRTTDDDEIVTSAFNAETEIDMPDPETGEGLVELKGTLKTLVQGYVRAVTNVMADRNLFTTSMGFLGVGPRGAGQGHKVVVLEGAETPFVMQVVGYIQGEDLEEAPVCLYRIVGECYLHGWMEGVAFDEASGIEVLDIGIV